MRITVVLSKYGDPQYYDLVYDWKTGDIDSIDPELSKLFPDFTRAAQVMTAAHDRGWKVEVIPYG